MKIGLLVEGGDDEAFYAALLERLLTLPGEAICVLNRRGECIRGLKAGLPREVKEFDLRGCTHLILSADRHGASPGEAARLAQEASGMAGHRTCLVAEAVISLEAWLLADHECLARALGKLPFDRPTQVEALRDPKHYLASRYGRPTAAQLKQIARTMDLEHARRQAASLDRFLKDLDKWKQ